ncbi:MAG: type I 3-dehydroquinate dehydratase [Calditrichia bacterium]
MDSSTPEFCISLLPHSFSGLMKSLSSCTEGDLIEIRLDYLGEVDFREIRQATDKRIIITCRTPAEGGFYNGSPASMISSFQAAINNGMDFIDVSYSLAGQLLSHLSLTETTSVVLSHHTGERNPAVLQKILAEMLTRPADVYKLVFTAVEENDSATALGLIDFAQKMKVNFIIHAMGMAGKPSRIIGAIRGNCWTYVALDEHSTTAPGQLTIDEALHRYYLGEKSSRTEIVGLLGYPLSQSKGWLLYNSLFHLHKHPVEVSNDPLDALYLNFEFREAQKFWNNWRKRLTGLSVTIPHKETVLKFASLQSEEVVRSGVCNTLVKRDGIWQAFNTDLPAMMELLLPYKKKLETGVLVVGSGATAGSAIAALQMMGVEKIFVTARNLTRVSLLEQRFSGKFETDKKIDGGDIGGIIQTTPVGMYPDSEALAPGSEFFKNGLIVFDVVYNPPETRFLKLARERGCITISGEEMFLRQAARQFELFSGQPVSFAEIKKVWREI